VTHCAGFVSSEGEIGERGLCPERNRALSFNGGGEMLYGLVVLLVVVAIVLFLAKVAIGGGILGLIALIVLVLLLLGRL
jgi:hypothetical protein